MLTIRRISSPPDGKIAGVITIRSHAEPLTVMASPIDGGFDTRFEIDRLRFDVRGGRVMSRLIGRMVRVHLVLRGSVIDSRRLGLFHRTIEHDARTLARGAVA